ARDLCQATLSGKGSGKPLQQRVADAIAAFEKLGVTVDQLESKLDRKSDKWTEMDLGELLVIHGSLKNGEVTVEQEFPSKKVTADELTAAPEAEAK
ncbi:hypothetical protein ADL26_20715, partial [Thermoactinomyces vulgaris]